MLGTSAPAGDRLGHCTHRNANIFSNQRKETNEGSTRTIRRTVPPRARAKSRAVVKCEPSRSAWARAARDHANSARARQLAKKQEAIDHRSTDVPDERARDSGPRGQKDKPPDPSLLPAANNQSWRAGNCMI
jgi:hypothetical protein